MTTRDLPLEVSVEADYEALSRRGAEAVLDTLGELADEIPDRRVNAIFSAGRTPTRVYELLAAASPDRFDWSRIRLFQMDEYIDVDDPGLRFNPYLRRQLVEPLCLHGAHLLAPHPADEPEAWIDDIRRQAAALRAQGGADFVLHGIGTNGHLGFNEPGTATTSEAAIVRLAQSTRDTYAGANAPRWGVTLGLSVLLAARASLLLASGAAKAAAIHATVVGPVTTSCPASALRGCRAVSVIVDQAAAALLGRADPG